MWVDVDTAITVPVNIFPLTDDTDFKTRETGITYDQAGMDLVWNFQTTAGVTSQTAVTPTTAGDYDWTHSGDGMYKLEITASGGASINNDAEGTGWFTGICTGVLAWRGPEIHFRAAALNNALIDGGDTLDVNVTTVSDTAQTANDNGADINTLLTRIIGTLASGTHNPATAAQIAVLSDWIDAGRLDLILDIIAADTTTDLPALIATAQADLDTITGADGTTLATSQPNYAPNTVVPDAAGVAPTAVENRQEMDSNSVDLNELISVLSSGISGETRNANLLDQLKTVIAIVEHQRGSHTHQSIGNILFVDPVNGDTHASGNRGGISDPYSLVQDCHDNAVTDSNHDLIILLSGAAAGATTLTEAVTLSKRYLSIRGPGRDFIWTRSGAGDTISITADGIGLEGFQLNTAATGSGNGVQVTDADFIKVEKVWINSTQGDGINILRGENCTIKLNIFTDTGQGGSGQGIHISGTAGASDGNSIMDNRFRNCAGDAILISNGTTNDTHMVANHIEGSSGWGINIGASSTDAQVYDNFLGNNASGDINDGGTTTLSINNEQWSIAGDEMALTAAATSAQLVDDFCDEVISKAAHNVPQSLAKAIRQGSDLIQIDGVVSDASPTTTDFDTNLTQIDAYFTDAVMIFANGSANAGIGKPIDSYVNANGHVTFDATIGWSVTPINGDDFVIIAIHEHPISELQSGLATEAKQDIIDTNVDSILVDTADMQPRVAAIEVDTGTTLDAAIAVIDANVDTTVLGIITGAAATGTLSTTQATSDLSGYTDDQLIGRIITVTSGPAEGESSAITDYVEAGGLITFDLMTLAMADGNNFKIT